MAVDKRYIRNPVQAAPLPDAPIWQMRVDQYHQMIRNGIRTADDPVELLEGLLVTKMPKNPPHRLANELARDVLAESFPLDGASSCKSLLDSQFAGTTA
jgi:hypothetical protein